MTVAYVIALRTSTEASSTTRNVETVAALRPRLAQASDDVLDVDDGVVDHHPDRDHQPRQHHHVDRRVPQVEHQDRRDQRQRDRDQADERRAQLEQEGGDDEDHQHARR